MFGLIEFSNGSQAICPMKDITQEGNLHIVKYKGAKYEAGLLITNETREKLQEIQKNGKTESESVNCKKNKAAIKKLKNTKVEKNTTNVTRRLLSDVSSPAPESTPSLSHIRSPIAPSTVDNASSDASTGQHNLAIMPEIVAHAVSQKQQETQDYGESKSSSVSCKKKGTLYKKPKNTKFKKKSENMTCKLLTEVSSPTPESVVPTSDIRSPIAPSTVKDVPLNASTDQCNSTIVPETIVHDASQKLREVQNTLATKSNPVIELTKPSSHKPKISTREEQLENVSRKLFTADSSPASKFTVLPSDVGSSAATSRVEDTPFDALSTERHSTVVPETVIHSISQRPGEIGNTLITESDPVIKPKKQTCDKPKIVLVENISPKSNSKLFKQSGFLIPEFGVSLSQIYAPVSNFINKSDEHPSPGQTSLDRSFCQQNLSGISGTVIEETDESSPVRANYTMELNSGNILDEYLINDVEFNTTAHDSVTSLLTGAKNQHSDFNFSFYKFYEPSLNNTGILAPEEISTSKPDPIVHNLNSNIGENDEKSIENNARPAINPVFKVPPCTEAPSDGELGDSEPDDPDYEPRGQNSSDSASDAENSTDQNINHKLDTNNNSAKDISKASSGFNISASDSILGSNGIDDDAMQVAMSRGRNGDKKLNFCFYCHKKQSKIARHLELKHKDEEDVKKFSVLPKKNNERRKIIDIIRKKGNFLFNTRSEYNDGELIVSRRPNTKFDRSARQFKACANCKAFFAISSLRVHFQKCTGISSKATRQVMVMSKKVVRRIHSRATPVTRDVLFPPLREDEIVRLIRYDELVIIYANKMCQKYKDPRDYQMVRQRIRLLGRLLSTLRKLNKEITDLTSVYDPKFCDDVLEAINIEAKLGVVSTNNYKTPSVASSLGTLLKQIGSILINECIKKHDEAKQKFVEDFLKLLAQEVTLSVNRTVEESQAQYNRRKKVELPSMEDIKKLHTYLSQKRKEAFHKLSNEFSEKEWMNLAETTLTSVQLFNRRRAGEIERTLIEDFKNYQSIDVNTDKDLFKSLSKQNQETAKKYVRFTIRGKLNRTVPVLLDEHLLESIELILHHRKDMKINKKNPYVFGLRGGGKSHKFLRACALMRKFSVDCGATNPVRLRGTKLRKHIATTCISLNLSENEVTDLANFMGHAEKIHKDIYRQPLVNREILRMSRLLEAARGAEHSEDDNDNSEDDDDEELENNHHGPSANSSVGQNTDETHDPDDPSEISIKSEGKKYTGSIKKKRSTSPYGPVRRVPWNDDEKNAVLRLFGANLKHMKLPSLQEIQKAINDNPCLRNRTPPQIKTWIHNQTKKKK